MMDEPQMEGPFDAQQFATDVIRQIAGHLPPVLLLLPPLSGCPDTPSSWRAVPLYAPGLPSALEKCLEVSQVRWLSRTVGSHPPQLSKLPSPPKDLQGLTEEITELPLDELLDGITEAAVEQLNTAMWRGICLSELSLERLLRSIGEIITGIGSPPQTDFSKGVQKAWATQRKRLRDTSGHVGWGNLEQIIGKRPVLLTDARSEECLAVKLPRKVSKNKDYLWDAISRGMCEHKSESATKIPNPLLKTLYALCDEAQRAVTSVTATSDKSLDIRFINRLRKQGRLTGRGEYRNFSLTVVSQESDEFILVMYTLGDRPFLQQVTPEPIYVYWDLKRYPIQVYVTVVLGNPDRLPLTRLNDVGFYAYCNHPSILKHAFCKGVEGSRTEVSICMEKTRKRILEWHRQQPTYDPVVCFLEQMRAAGRVLRYGVRARDQTIQQHNSFHKVPNPEAEFQAVIRGLDQARAFALSRGAEIVPYNR